MREHLVLIYAKDEASTDTDTRAEEDEGHIFANLNIMVPKDPFPGRNLAGGGEMFWFKTYSENEGLLEQLEQAGWVKSTPRTITDELVTLPMVELKLSDAEITQWCAHCERFETTSILERYKKCSKCKRRYYCCVEHQHADWPEHKLDCKLLASGNFAAVENSNRAKVTRILSSTDTVTV
ncbi:hypothetical protein ACM66B_002563 [Microbotryomycetes sp. NB124-2]